MHNHKLKTYTSEHTRSCTANLQMVLSNFSSVEHCVERCDLVDLHGCHLKNFGNFIHSRECQEVVVLLLSNEKGWNHSRGLIITWVLLDQNLNSIETCLSEFER